MVLHAVTAMRIPMNVSPVTNDVPGLDGLRDGHAVFRYPDERRLLGSAFKDRNGRNGREADLTLA